MKNKEYIRASAFITSLLILLVLMFSGFSVFAAGTVNVFTQYNIDSYFTNDDFPSISNPNFIGSNYVGTTSLDNLLSSGLNISDSVTDYPYTFTDYVWFNGDVINCTSGSFVVIDNTNNQGSRLYYKIDTSDRYFKFTKANYGGSTNVWDIDTQTDGRVVTIGSDRYFMWGGYSTLFLLNNTNLAIYPVSSIEDTLTSLPSSDNINPNYSGSNVETSSNNLYLEDAYFLWTTYDPVNDNIIGDNFNVDNIYNSFVTFNYQLTDYQKEHLSEFTINVKASISYSMKFTGQSDYKNWSGSYLYEAPLSQFNTGTLKYTFIDIFNSTGFTSYFNNNYTGEIDFSNSSFKLTMDAELVDNKGGTSSDYIDIFDFLNNKVRNQSKAITNNNNPYVPTDSGDPIQSNAQVPTVQTGDGVVPTGNNSVSPSGSGTVNVVQNNNSGLINPKPVTDMVKNELLPNENDTNFVGLLAEQTHEDGFVSLMSTTFSFVPVTVWTSLSHYFNIFLTMLVAFFALRLILDIL